jgi:RNA polymerase sigma factor (sigma-70 family)
MKEKKTHEKNTQKEIDALNKCIQNNDCADLVKHYWNYVFVAIQQIIEKLNNNELNSHSNDMINAVFHALQKNNNRRLKQYKTDGGKKLSSWIYTICEQTVSNYIRDHIEDPNKFVPLLEALELPDDRQITPNLTDTITLEDCLQQLSRNDRIAIKLKYYEGYTSKEIADVLYSNENAVNNRLHEAKKRLQNCLEA